MNLIQLRIELFYQQEFQSYSISEQLYEVLTKKSSQVVQHQEEPGIIMRSNKKKEAVAWDKDSCKIAIEYSYFPG